MWYNIYIIYIILLFYINYVMFIIVWLLIRYIISVIIFTIIQYLLDWDWFPDSIKEDWFWTTWFNMFFYEIYICFWLPINYIAKGLFFIWKYAWISIKFILSRTLKVLYWIVVLSLTTNVRKEIDEDLNEKINWNS